MFIAMAGIRICTLLHVIIANVYLFQMYVHIAIAIYTYLVSYSYVRMYL